MENESVVTQDTGSATVESNIDPSTSQDAGTQEAATQTQPRSYTQDDINKIIRARLAQQKGAYEKQISEFKSQQARYEQAVGRMNQGIEAMGRGFGFIQDEQRDPVSDKFSQFERQFEEKLNQRFQKAEEERLYTSIQNDWKAVSEKHKEWASLPGFKDAWAKSWAPGQDPNAVAAKLVSAYEQAFAARANATAAGKEARLRSAPVKPGGGTVAGAQSENKVPLRKSILAALRDD